jgi:hypothetical protein
MDSDLKKKIQIILAIGIVLVAGRTAMIMYQRSHATDDGRPREAADVVHHELNADDYVYERPFYGYDLASTKKALVGKTTWMKAGYYLPALPYDPATKRVTQIEKAPLIPPLEPIEIADVILAPGKSGRTMFAIFKRDGKPSAVHIGVEKNGDFRMDVENVLYRQDPRQLFKHWSKDVWAAIDRHEALPGMNEQQVWLALGYGAPLNSGNTGDRTMRYENPGHPKEVRFQKNAAVEIKDAEEL